MAISRPPSVTKTLASRRRNSSLEPAASDCPTIVGSPPGELAGCRNIDNVKVKMRSLGVRYSVHVPLVNLFLLPNGRPTE